MSPFKRLDVSPNAFYYFKFGVTGVTTIGEKFDSDFATAQNKLKFFRNFNGFAKVVKT